MMNKRNPLFLGIFLLLSISSFGQKIKYKDLFVLLNAKQFDQAEPFLKKYLVENMDNPNALLFMAYILEEKALADDVLTELEKVKNHSDSGALYFDLAYKSIDEKELRKNDEYYQMYSRRDLRTGKFGIKISDVQVDIEKRSKYLRDREQRVIELHQKFNATKKIYVNIESLFKVVTSRYKDRTEFFLRSDENLKSELKNLARKYDSLLISFNDYTSHLATLGKTGHNQEFDVQQIDGFKHDGYVEPDFLQDEIKIWDYKRWALVNLDIIENEIDPSRASLVKIDAELNDLREKLRKDSVEVSAEAKDIYQKAYKLSIRKYDPRPMPLDVFSLKVKELNYGSNLVKTSALRDSTDLKLQRDLLTRDIALLSGVDSVATVLNKRDMETDLENYKGFVKDAYGSASVLKSLIKTTGDFAVAERTAKEKRVEQLLESINWIIDGADSIPVTSAVKSNTYFPVVTVPDKYTFGLKMGDTLKNYFYTITPSRKPDISVKLPADTLFKKDNQDKIKGLSTVTNNKNYIAVLYSEQKIEDKISGFVYQVAANGLVWSTNILMEGIPSELTYIEEGKNILIKTTIESGFKTLILDSKGKVIAYN